MDIFERIAELRRKEQLFALATLVHAESGTPRKIGSRMIVFPDEKIEGSIGGGALEKTVIKDAKRLMKEGKSERFKYELTEEEGKNALGMACGGTAEVLIEAFGKREKLFIFGAGHIGRKLCQLCDIIEMPCWIIDSRKEYAKKEFFPDSIHVIHSDFEESFVNLPIDEESYIVIVTYGHIFDSVCLKHSLRTKAKYIGMIGSKNKVKGIKQRLSKEGFNIEDPRIFAPIGLQIGDYTPGEIAVSIIAEILKIKTHGSGLHLKDVVK